MKLGKEDKLYYAHCYGFCFIGFSARDVVNLIYDYEESDECKDKVVQSFIIREVGLENA